MDVSPIKQPAAIIPIAMSIAALLTVLYHIAMFGIRARPMKGPPPISGRY